MASPVTPLGVVTMSAWLFWPVFGTAEPPPLSADAVRSRAGYFVLDWHDSPGGRFELRERQGSAPARLLYSGPDTARLISGRANGNYRYQVRRVGETDWSAPLRVTVEHHSLSRALGFFLIGALVFIATLVLVVRGARNG